MQENLILAYYAQKWKFSPRLPKMEFFKKVSFFWKGLQISLLTSPQTPADIKFKSSYVRNILSKKLSLGLNFSTPSGGVTSPSLKGSMAISILQSNIIVLAIKSGIFKWYALHYMFVRGSLRVPFIIVSTTVCSNDIWTLFVTSIGAV